MDIETITDTYVDRRGDSVSIIIWFHIMLGLICVGLVYQMRLVS